MSELNWSDVHPSQFERAFLQSALSMVGTPFDEEGTIQEPGVALDCSGMIIEIFEDLGVAINDRTAAQLASQIFTRISPPVRGPVIQVSFGDGALSDHIAFHPVGRVVIHSTTDEDLVALNGGNDGVMVTKSVDYFSILGPKTNLSVLYLDFGALLSYHNSEQ